MPQFQLLTTDYEFLDVNGSGSGSLLNCSIILEQSLHPQSIYICSKNLVKSIDFRVKAELHNLFALSNPVHSLLQHKSNGNYLFASTDEQLLLMDIRHSRKKPVKTPILIGYVNFIYQALRWRKDQLRIHMAICNFILGIILV